MRESFEEKEARLLKELAHIREQRDQEKRGDAKYIAELLHKKFCHANHIDGCSWDYESWSSPGYVKSKYLETAKSLIAWCNERDVTVVDATDLIKRISV